MRIKKLCIFMIVVSIGLTVISCSFGASTQTKFDELCKGLKDRYLSTGKHSEAPDDKHLSRLIRELGLDYSSGETLIDYDFMVEYVNSNSVESLIDKIKIIGTALSQSSYGPILDLSTERYNSIVKTSQDCLANSGYKMSSFNKSDRGKDGFYKNNDTAEPKPKVTEESHRVYTYKWETTTKQTRTSVSYYGDFAIESIDGYRFNEGKYGWYGGKFYDEPSHWEHYTAEHLWYKGKDLSGYYEFDFGSLVIAENETGFYRFALTTDDGIYNIFHYGSYN